MAPCIDTILDITKVAVGLVYLYFEYYAKRELWIASVIMPLIGIILFYNKGLYADCAINIYYLAIAVYGFATWSRRPVSGNPTALPITHIRPLTALAVGAVWLCIWALVACVLATFTNSTVVALDSFTASLSIVGMWMLARKYIEQWGVWLVVDAVYVWLYYRKGIYFSGTLYAFYTVMAVVGYGKWLRIMRASD